MNDYLIIILALVGSPLVAYITVRASRPKVRADATKTITDTALALVEPQKQRIVEMQERVDRLEAKIERLEDEVDAVRRWAKLLWTQVVEAGATPMSFAESENLRDKAD